MTKKIYQEPEMKVVALHLEGSVLSASTILNEMSGEDITYGDEVNPWN